MHLPSRIFLSSAFIEDMNPLLNSFSYISGDVARLDKDLGFISYSYNS